MPRLEILVKKKNHNSEGSDPTNCYLLQSKEIDLDSFQPQKVFPSERANDYMMIELILLSI